MIHQQPRPLLNQFNAMPPMRKSQFRFVAHKGDGVNSGGIYKDSMDQKWLLKGSHGNDISNAVNEYIAGGVYQYLLGDYAPRTELVYNETSGNIMVGSKILPNFQTLSEFDKFGQNNSLKKTHLGKPIKNFNNVLAAVMFLQDADGHKGNIGIQNLAHSWQISKIDHGFAFKRSTTKNLSEFHSQMGWYSGKLSDIGFENMYQSIKMMANVNYAEIERIVTQKAANAKVYVNKDAESRPFRRVNLDTMKRDILSRVRSQIGAFKQIQKGMELERAINQDNVAEVRRLFNQGYNLRQHMHLFDHRQHDSIFGVKPADVAKRRGAQKVLNFYRDTLNERPTPAVVQQQPKAPAPLRRARQQFPSRFGPHLNLGRAV